MPVAMDTYRLQITLGQDARKALRHVASDEDTSIQKLVERWLIEKLKEYPYGKGLRLPAAPDDAARARG